MIFSIEYKIIHGKNTDIIMKNVNIYIRNGWRPIGGICIGSFGFYQAMTKEKRA